METVSLLVRGIFDWHGSILLFSPQAFIILITAYLLQYTDGETLRKVWVKVEQLHWTWIAIGVAVLLTLILALAPSGVMPFIYFQF
jgi:hypothetical protein